jgi:hypothetical protein
VYVFLLLFYPVQTPSFFKLEPQSWRPGVLSKGFVLLQVLNKKEGPVCFMHERQEQIQVKYIDHLLIWLRFRRHFVFIGILMRKRIKNVAYYITHICRIAYIMKQVRTLSYNYK